MSNNASTTLFLIDNFDSFGYNLVDEMRKLGFAMQVYRNNISADLILQKMQQTAGKAILILSPGPGAPSEAGCVPELLKKVAGLFPVLGICLGHQAIVEHYGGVVDRASEVLHGKSSNVNHCQDKMFSGLQHPLPVARYHSLMATQLPSALEVLAQYQDVPMAVYHQTDNMLGFQFHPESILTSQGSRLLTQSIAFLAKD